MCCALDIIIPNSQMWEMSSEWLSIFPHLINLIVAGSGLGNSSRLL